MSSGTWTLPLKIKNGANAREHWAEKSKRVARERETTRTIVEPPLRPIEGHVWFVLTRVSPRPFDSDGLAISFKAVRDELARIIGRDDNPKAGVTWLYQQRKGEPKQNLVEVQALREPPKICPYCLSVVTSSNCWYCQADLTGHFA